MLAGAVQGASLKLSGPTASSVSHAFMSYDDYKVIDQHVMNCMYGG